MLRDTFDEAAEPYERARPRCPRSLEAALGRQRPRAHPTARVGVADSERWELPAEPFGAAVCAIAFHWIGPALRVVKAARAPRPGGCLALVTAHHVAGGTQDFFERAQRCYERGGPFCATPSHGAHALMGLG